ncbi:MAG: ATP-binding protein, partial [Bacteroidales bacterium]
SFTPVNGKIAFATTSGIFAYDYATRKIELLDKRLQGYYTNLCKDSLNRLWLTRTNALICYDPASGEINRYPYQISSGEELILLSKNLLSDSNGNIWFTTRGDGVFCFDPESKTFRMFNEHNCGLKGRISYAIRELSPELMLISTNKGLSILNTSQRTCVNLSSEKGFPLTSMSPGDILQEKGEIYLSGKEGLFRIDSAHLFSANTDFNLWFSQLKINNRLVFPSETNSPLSKMISHSDKLVLNHKHTIVSFLFASDQYQKTAHTDFQYKLEGFDLQWQTAPANRELTYMNLPPGKYTLRVRGYSPLQPEHQKTIKLDVDILPHPLKSSWAYLCYGIIFIISAGLIIKLLYGRLKLKNSLYFAEKEKRHIEATNQSKINFFTNISHELRTPLTLITGQLQMVLHSDTILPSLRGRISNIHQNANRMQQLINELLDFQKQEQEGLTLKITEENIPPFIEDIFLSFKDYALFKGITYTFDKPADDFKTWIDPIQFRKILFNLLSNAFKYCNENGHIALRLQKEDTAFSIEVTDSGSGIPENAREKIFDRFYQIEQSSASNPQIIGTGIGLSVTKGIVEAHGGSISVKSEPGNGSTFTVSIPFDPSKFGKSEIISQTTQPLNNKTAIHAFNPENEDYQAEITLLKKQINPDIKILLVEDNRELQEMLCRIFGQFSEVFCAENGVEGLQKTIEIQPDLIISDIMMPQMSGVEMCRQIKADPTLSHIPVILLTARSSAGQNIEGLKSGADDFISKPFNLSVLITRCMNLLLSRQMLREKFTKEFDAKPRIITSSETDQQLLEKVIRIIEENMENEAFSIPLLAKALTMSQSSFTNKLKALTNQTPLDFVMTIRLRKGA